MAGHLCKFWWLAPKDYGKARLKRPEEESNPPHCTPSSLHFHSETIALLRMMVVITTYVSLLRPMHEEICEVCCF
jgi:hypothetical protein